MPSRSGSLKHQELLALQTQRLLDIGNHRRVANIVVDELSSGGAIGQAALHPQKVIL
jgi:hypothetical protein